MINSPLTELGWREWLALPDMQLPALIAKVDTGARSSALHAFDVQKFSEGGQPWLRIGLHPVKDNNDIVVWREVKQSDERPVTDSGGHTELRPVITTALQLAGERFDIELTLTNRDSMKFRVLLGRTAMRDRCVVNPAKSWLLGTAAGDNATALYARENLPEVR